MASIYTKKGSSFFWLRYKDATGRWRGKQTGYRLGNLGDQRQAKLLARKQSEIEAERVTVTGDAFADWVLPWLIATYGGAETTTLDVYSRMWRTLTKFLVAHDISRAAQLERKHVTGYLAWRTVTASRNMAIQEIKMMGMILGEAISRGQCATNPFSKPGLVRDKAADKSVWSDTEIIAAAAHFEKFRSRWMRCAFYFGLYQACRLRQCQVPLAAIRFDLNVIQYPDRLVKGHAGFTQPIDARFRDILHGLVAEARAAGETSLCKVPWDASLRLRQSLNRIGYPHLVHHGLRVTWITRAAENGIPESQAMAFCHHESREVHRIYKKLSSVGIAHVPALMSLPALPGPARAEDEPQATTGSGPESSGSRTRKRIPAPCRHKRSGGSSRKTEPLP